MIGIRALSETPYDGTVAEARSEAARRSRISWPWRGRCEGLISGAKRGVTRTIAKLLNLEIQLGQMNSAEGVAPDKLERAINEFESLYSAFVTPGLTDIIQEDVNPVETSSEAITLQVAQVRERQLTNSFDFLGIRLIKFDPQPDRCQFDHGQVIS